MSDVPEVAGGEQTGDVEALIERYVADPAQLSLEEQRAIYQHVLGQRDPNHPEAERFRRALASVDQALAQAKHGDSAFTVRSNGTYRRVDAQLRLVRVDELRPDPANGTLFRDIEGEDFEQLKDSIGGVGILEPLIADRELRVICGHQRLRAARAMGLESVPVVIRDVADDRMRATMAIEENIRRRHLQPSEMARAVKKLAELRETKEAAREIAKEIGLSERQVHRYRTLADLIPELSAVLDAGHLPQSSAIQIAQLDADVQRALHTALGERIAHALHEQKAIEFKRAHAELLEEVKDLSAATKKLEQRKAELEGTLGEWKARLERAEFKTGDEIKARKLLEEELEKTRAEMYHKVQEKQALIDKLTDTIEPVAPPDYRALKSENAKLKVALKERPNSMPASDVIVTHLQYLISRVVATDPADLVNGLSPTAKEEFRSVIEKLDAWMTSVRKSLDKSGPIRGRGQK